ncbi:hypothetical protein FOWG_10145 [Fusarium oxysporum f. sp. lycopersici MN25]|uniref:Uncharacterized protein n=1 Tax=Fusarium oxysporum Fo47 TaxID=660027 RepID=W9LBK0_FUSOX|nr:hypothetical protein FOZG_02147 [Fusarium oxysporum Fo47]EWZ86583.1 hypothetical protein FOWG_10145 [Fusarium oxysporum f. sp. lycopersici MN25]
MQYLQLSAQPPFASYGSELQTGKLFRNKMVQYDGMKIQLPCVTGISKLHLNRPAGP